MAYYWLSFTKKKKFLGGCLVVAKSPSEAIEETHRWECNPGGEITIDRVDAKWYVDNNKFQINQLYDEQSLQAKYWGLQLPLRPLGRKI